jgi:hypothetical protein
MILLFGKIWTVHTGPNGHNSAAVTKESIAGEISRYAPHEKIS